MRWAIDKVFVLWIILVGLYSNDLNLEIMSIRQLMNLRAYAQSTVEPQNSSATIDISKLFKNSNTICGKDRRMQEN